MQQYDTKSVISTENLWLRNFGNFKKSTVIITVHTCLCAFPPIEKRTFWKQDQCFSSLRHCCTSATRGSISVATSGVRRLLPLAPTHNVHWIGTSWEHVLSAAEVGHTNYDLSGNPAVPYVVRLRRSRVIKFKLCIINIKYIVLSQIVCSDIKIFTRAR